MSDYSEETKTGILLHLLDKQYEELSFRRQREFSIFLWTATIFVAIISLVVSSDVLKGLLSCWGRVIGCVILSLICFFSISWQNRERKLSNENSRTIARIQSILHAYQPGYYCEESLFPVDWAKWGQHSVNRVRRYFRGNFLTATWVLALGAIMSIILV